MNTYVTGSGRSGLPSWVHVHVCRLLHPSPVVLAVSSTTRRMRLVEVAAQFRGVVQSECTLMYFGIDAKWAREDLDGWWCS